jgi:predicted nucleic acid-binding protein
MAGEPIVDASVIGAALFDEAGSEVARRFLGDDHELTAPSLLALEVASIAAKKVWRGDISVEGGEEAMADFRELLPTLANTDDFAERAYRLAAFHRFSVYDAAYLAMAEERNGTVITLDEKLVSKAVDQGFGHLVEALR